MSKAASLRERFSPQFKAAAAQLVVIGDRIIAEVAHELEVLLGILENWLNKYWWENAEEESERPLSVSD